MLQPLPAAPDAFVWLRLYQAQLSGLAPPGRDEPFDGPCVFRTAFLVVISGCVLPVQVLVADLAWGLVVKSRMETL
ncbi:MAG: hypothetical protein ACRDSR_21325, partial [Pseudonocardiaceae bacterium]